MTEEERRRYWHEVRVTVGIEILVIIAGAIIISFLTG